MTTSRNAALAALLTTMTLLVGGLLVAAPAQAATTASSPRLLVYGQHDLGVSITRPRQAWTRLPGAPRDFRRFVARQVRHIRATSECQTAFNGVTVVRVRTDGFARGAVNDCGGYVALWKRIDGRWTQIQGTQDIWTCQVLRRHQVPAAVVRPAGQCYDGHDVVTYHHR
jgi:hypothetical protein